uniref:Dolichyl-diphosphooligosaccharide--protein glycosyltransferase subunit 2 n=1 Tax=Meloidogyne hapla TaxID=6305 RepID=A0A1I8AYM7_MELHA
MQQLKIFFIYFNLIFILLIIFIKKNNSFNNKKEEEIPLIFYNEIKLINVQVQVREWQSGKQLGNFTIPSENNEKYSKGIRLEEKLVINLQFNIIDKNTKKLIEGIQQKFLRLWHSKTEEHEAMPRDFNRFGSRPGRYHCELLIGDIRIKNPFRWHLIDVFVDIPKVWHF